MRPVFLCVLIYVYGSRTLLNLGVRILTLRVYLLHSSEYSLTAEAIKFFHRTQGQGGSPCHSSSQGSAGTRWVLNLLSHQRTPAVTNLAGLMFRRTLPDGLNYSNFA